tara:strand:+ start:2760 stop:4052 length:1293 start_codon:yes stop_codon:yes gene_type:complete
MHINKERLWSRIEKLSEFTDPDAPWTRRAFTDVYSNGRAWLEREMQFAGLTTRIDKGGNLIGHLSGKNEDAPIIATGSHIDTVPSGGRYDGILGVIAGLEVLQSINESGHIPEHGMEVIDFLSEEPSDYGVSCIGSRAMVGKLNQELLSYKNSVGETLSEAIMRVGGTPIDIETDKRLPGDLACFVELHIEQGKLLETNGSQVGNVSHIVGIKRYDITFEGQADHAGTTPMDLRKDALVGASSFVQYINQKAKDEVGKEHYLVATIGKIDVKPNAANAIPEKVSLVVEVRSDRNDLLNNFLTPIIEWTYSTICPEYDLNIKVKTLSKGTPTACSRLVQDTINEAAEKCNKNAMVMPSGAGHDAVYLSEIAPIGMIFTPCRDGRSHCPEESMSKDEASDGTKVLAEALLQLDKKLSTKSANQASTTNKVMK